MSHRRSDRKLRPPWIQTQLDQGYRPYSFYVEYQRTTPLVRSGGHSPTATATSTSTTAPTAVAVAAARPSKRDIYTTDTTATTTTTTTTTAAATTTVSPGAERSPASEKANNDRRPATNGGQTAAKGLVANASSSSSNSSGGSGTGTELPGNTDKPAGTSIAQDKRGHVGAVAAGGGGVEEQGQGTGSDSEARLTRIWYRTGAWPPIVVGADNTSRHTDNGQRQTPPRQQLMERADGGETGTSTSAATAMASRREPPADWPTTPCLGTESETDAGKWKVGHRWPPPPPPPPSEEEHGEVEDFVTDEARVRQGADATVALPSGVVVVGRETRPVNASVTPSPKTALAIDEMTSTERRQVRREFVPTSAGETADNAATSLPAGQTTYDDVTDERHDVTDQVSGQTERDVTVMYSDIPQATSDAIDIEATSLSGREPSGSASNPDFDTSARNPTDIPGGLDDAPERGEAGTTTGSDAAALPAVTAEAAASAATASPTTRQPEPEVIPCSTKHRSKTKRPAQASRPPRRRNRNRKRTRLRNAQTPSPSPGLSMGYGVRSTAKYPLHPLPNPYHPQIRITEPPALVAPPREHPVATNSSTFTISGLSSAEVTGIAIGCIVAFWIILGPLVCIICRMRDRAKEKRREREQEDSMSHTLIEEMIRMELARGRAKLYRTDVDDEREIERLQLQGDCCNACNGNGHCVINPQDYVIGNRYMEYTPVNLMPAPPSDSDKDFIVNKTYMDSLDIKSAAGDTNL